MCLAIPAQIVELQGATARVRFAVEPRWEAAAGRVLLPAARPGDWVYICGGQIIAIVPPGQVEGLLALFEEIFECG